MWRVRLGVLLAAGVAGLTAGAAPLASRTAAHVGARAAQARPAAACAGAERAATAGDESFAPELGAALRGRLFLGYALLGLCGGALALGAARLWWRGALGALRRSLRGDGAPPDLPAPLEERRGLVARDPEPDGPSGAWTPERLRLTLARHLYGERVITVANREPYLHERTADGGTTVRHPASGLVTALEPVVRACSGVWVAHGSGSADREIADAHGRIAVPPGEESYLLRRIWLGAEEERGYYYGCANEGLWPLCHLAHVRPVFSPARSHGS
jgi:trehalose 6-phosphate synthase